VSVQIFLGAGLAAGARLRPAPRGPVALRPPALTGAGRIGGALGVDPGEWRGAAGFAFAWLRDGAPIPGALGAAYAPTAADDRAAVACRVTATGPLGAAAAETPAVTITFPPPSAVGPIPDLLYTQSSGSHDVDISPFFLGNSLRFSVTGDGVAVDSATGIVTLDLAALAAGGAVVVTAANSGGQVELDLRLRVATPPVLLAPPALSGTGVVGAALSVDPGLWAGQPAPALALQWLADGAPLAGATGAEFVPGAAEDGAAVACRVSATNPAGAAAAETAAVTVAHVPPAATGALPDLVLARGAAAAAVPAAGAFAGAALVFAIEGAGAAIDAATGVATIPTDATRVAAPVTISATNSGGAAQVSFTVTVLAAPAALAPPAPAIFDLAPGTASIEAAAFFAGDALGFALEAAPAGVTIDAIAGVVRVPTDAALAGEIAVAATNAVGAAVQRLAVTVRPAIAAPVALGAPAPVVFLQGTGTQSVSAQAFFAGADLAYALEAAPAGVTIDAGSGLLAVPTEAALAGEVAVRATNAGGAATQRFALRVEATRTVFDAAAALGDVRFLFESVAPGWTRDAAGFARLTPGAGDRAHGDWALARGDGRYRALARWTAGGAAPTQARPFGLIGRMTKTGVDFRGVRVDVVLQTGGARVLQVRDYAGSGTSSTSRTTAAVAWDWNAWFWLEAEFNGARVRARLYPEAGPVPNWQVSVSTTQLAPGAFGPTSHEAAAGQTPVVHLRRLEFQPLAAAAPAAPLAGDWTLDQTMVQE
jgi:hypothetical protein